jgi:hypothetical protein
VPSKAFFLLLGIGVTALLVRPSNGPVLVGLVVLGALACMGRVLMGKDGAPRPERLGAAILGLGIGGVAVYSMIRAGEIVGWGVFLGVLIFDAALVWVLTHIGRVCGRPIVRWRAMDERRPHEYGVAMIAAVLLAFAASFAAGTGKVPGIALGSPLILHVERAAALFAVLLLVFTTLVYAWKGVLPSEISSQGVGYAEITDKTETTLKELQDASYSSTQALRRTRKEVKELAEKVAKQGAES